MHYSFEVENIRCGGCANTITMKLTEIDGVRDVHVDVDEKKVIVSVDPVSDENIRQTLSEKLAKLGYPEIGAIGSNGLMTKATSVVSYAIGKISSKRRVYKLYAYVPKRTILKFSINDFYKQKSLSF